MREAVGDNGEEAATFDEPEGLKEAMSVMAERSFSTERARGEAGTPSFLEGSGGITDL